MKKKNKTRLILLLFLATLGLLFGVWYYNFTITPLDRPFFLSGKKEIIVATRVDWMCNCANYVDTTKYSTNPVSELDDNDCFFIETTPADQLNLEDNFEHRYVKLTGQFYIDKGIPEYFELGHIEDKPDHAKVFKVDKIEYLTADK